MGMLSHGYLWSFLVNTAVYGQHGAYRYDGHLPLWSALEEQSTNFDGRGSDKMNAES